MVINYNIICMQILKLGQIQVGKFTTGHLVNLSSNDVHHFDTVCLSVGWANLTCIIQGFQVAHFLWISPIHMAIVVYILYQEIQWCSFIVLGLVILQFPVHFVSVWKFTQLRYHTIQHYRIILLVFIFHELSLLKYLGEIHFYSSPDMSTGCCQ